MSIKPVDMNFQKMANWVGRNMSSPQQRLLQGVTGLAIQPIIEYKNKDVDDDTRAVATARIIGKVVSGAVVGIIVRGLCIAALGKVAKTPSTEEFAKLAQQGARTGKKAFKELLAPSVEMTKKIISGEGKGLADIYNDYRNGMGTLIGTLVGMYTNFSVDVPITEWMTDKLIPVVKNRINNDNAKASSNTAMLDNPLKSGSSEITPIDSYLISASLAPLIEKGGVNG